jgi:hypothetical protein
MKKFCFLIILLMPIFSGCAAKSYTGPETHLVDGVVTLDGTPFEGADIRFYPKEEGVGETASGKSASAGNFKLSSVQGQPGKGAMKGTYTVTVSKTEVVQLSPPKRDPVSGDPITQTSKEILPTVYQDPAKTPLEITIVEGINKVQLGLKSKP